MEQCLKFQEYNGKYANEHMVFEPDSKINKLFLLLQKPVLWQRSCEPFWDDEHISKGMLEAHLNPDRDAASRRHSFIDCSVKWLTSIIPSGSKILDLGCGPGLYTKRLSDAGYAVTGIDYSRRSIAYAKEHDPKTKYIYQNYLDMDFTEEFDVITLIYCDFAALIPDERKMLLSKIHRVLKPDGLFIFDVFTEKTIKGKNDNTSWSYHEKGGFWSDRPHLCLEAEFYFENNTVKVNKYIVITENGLHEYLIWDTVFTKNTLLNEVTPFGFQMYGIYDDVCGSSYTGEADTICLILRKG
ncbi:MAG TPA: class I SAM-dependent methyltransferase [Clostridiaceae bacterium]|nr:class I SAM-dependent methyltransferase [Clostridiaceae bacterium]